MIEFKESKFYKLLQDFFINNDKETFIQFLAEFYNRTEGIINKNNSQDDIIKELRELYLEFNEKGIDENIVREKVNYFLENNVKIKDILAKLAINANNIKNINSQIDTITINVPKSTNINDTELVQNCIDKAFSLGGGTVLLNDNYLINALTLKENVILKSYKKSKLTLISNIEKTINIIGNNVTIDNIIIDSNNKSIISVNIDNSYNNINIKNCIIKNNMDNGESCVVSGIKIGDNSTDINIINNEICNCVNNTDYVARGVFLFTRNGQTTSKNIIIKNNKIHDINPIGDADGIHLSGFKNQTNKNNILIDGNTFYNCSKRAIKVMASHVNIINNIIVSNYTNYDTEGMYSGISVYSSFVNIENNQIYNKSFKYGAIDVVGTDWEVRELTIKNNYIKVGQDGGNIYQGAIQFDNNVLENVIIDSNIIISSSFGIVFKRYSKNIKILNNNINSVNACIKTFSSTDFILCENFTITNNTLSGSANYCIHFEKGNNKMIVNSNTFTSKYEPIVNDTTELLIKNSNVGVNSINGIFAYRVTNLPAPSKELEGLILLKYVSGGACSLNVCVLSTGNYVWKEISYVS